MNYQASNPESLSETPERLSETKTRSGSPAAAAKKQAAEVLTSCTNLSLVSFPDPAFKLDKGLAHFARNLGLADPALPEIWRTNQIAFTC